MEQLPVSSDDPSLICAAAAGDDRAWRVLVHRYKRLVYSIPKRYRFSDNDCDDVFQAVFTLLVRALPKLQDSRALPKWLITTTQRECWRQGRTRRAPDLAEHAVTGESPTDAEVEGWERRQQLDAALTELGGRCEKLLRMLYLSSAQVPYELVAETLDMAVGSIGPTRSRCLAKLAELMPAANSRRDDDF